MMLKQKKKKQFALLNLYFFPLKSSLSEKILQFKLYVLNKTNSIKI